MANIPVVEVGAGNQTKVVQPVLVTGLDPSGNLIPMRADSGGNVTSTPSTSSQSAFGEALTADLTPFVQATACYNLLPANMRTYAATGGSATITGGEFKCQTGTSVGGYGVIRSVRSVNYKGGMGAVFRGTGRFTAGVPLSQQGVGFFNVGDGLLFGYHGEDFGIIHQHHGLQEVRTITVTGAAGGSTNLTLTLNDVIYTIPLTAGTTAHNAYQIEQWLKTNASGAWNANQNGNTVVISSTSAGPKSGVYSFSHATATGTITQVTAGVAKEEDFTPQADWNVDTASWLTDPTKTNVYQIKYQYLGNGDIFFFVENPNTGQFVLVHRIEWAGANSRPSLGNPSLHCGVYAASLGSTTNLTAYSACVAAFIEGTPGRTRNPRSFSNAKSVGTTLTSIMTIRNREVFGGRANQVEIEPLILTCFTESAKGARVYISGNPTLAGETNYSYLAETTLVAETSTAETTVTNGTPFMDLRIAGNSTTVIDLTPLRLRIPPGITINIAMAVNSGAAADSGASLTWYEDL